MDTAQVYFIFWLYWRANGANTFVYVSGIIITCTYATNELYTFNLNQKNSLQRLQNRGMRIVLKWKSYTPIKLKLEVLE